MLFAATKLAFAAPALLTGLAVGLLVAPTEAQIAGLPVEAELNTTDAFATTVLPFGSRAGRLLVESRLYVPQDTTFAPLLDASGKPWVERSLVLVGAQATRGVRHDPVAGIYAMPTGLHGSIELELGHDKPIIGTEHLHMVFLRTQVIELHAERHEVLAVHPLSDPQILPLTTLLLGYQLIPQWRPKRGGALPQESQTLLAAVDDAQRRHDQQPQRAPLNPPIELAPQPPLAASTPAAHQH